MNTTSPTHSTSALETPTMPLPDLIAWVEERLADDGRPSAIAADRQIREIAAAEAA